MTASIREISFRGVVKIDYSEVLIIPDRYREFDDTILEVRIIPDMRNIDENNPPNKNLTSWSISSFSGG